MAVNKEIIQFTAKGLKPVQRDIKKLEKRIRKLDDAYKKSTQGGKGVTKGMGAMVAKLGLGYLAFRTLSSAIGGTIRVGKEFEKEMSNVAAISGATAAQMQALEKNAKELGRTTVYTASNVAALQVEFAKLGFGPASITNVTKATLDLAAVARVDLAEAAAVAGTTLRAFGLDSKDTSRVTDVMALSFSRSALDMRKFTDSMKFVAPVAKKVGFSVEGTTAIMGALANAGIDGSLAGTALRTVFLKLADTNSALSKRLGGSVKSADDLVPALKKLKDEGVDLTEMLGLVDKRAVTAFSILVEGSDDVGTLKDQLDNAAGSAERMASIQLDNLDGSMTILKSATEGLGIAIFDTFDKGLRDAVDGITDMVSGMTELVAVPVSQKMEEQRIAAIGLLSAISNLDKEDKLRKDLIFELETNYGDLHKKIGTAITDNEKLKKALIDVNAEMMNQIIIQGQQEAIEKEIKAQAKAWMEYRASTKAVGETMLRFNAHTKGTIDLTADLSTQLGQAKKFLEGKQYKNAFDGTIMYRDGLEGLSATLDMAIISQEMAKRGYDASTMSVADLQKTMAELRVELSIPLPVDTAPGGGGGEGGEGPAPADPILEATEAMEAYMAKQQAMVDSKAQEAEWLDVITEMYPKLAKNMGLVVDEEEKQKKIKEEKQKLLIEELKMASLVQGSAIDAMKAVVRAETMEAVAGLIAGYLKTTPPPWSLILAAGAGGVVAGLMDEALSSFASGGDFVTNGPQMIMVGDNDSGAEHVQVTPLGGAGSARASGAGAGSIVINISAPLVDETVIDSIIPAIAKAQRLGLA